MGQATTTTKPAAARPAPAPTRVLVVDDDKIILTSLAEFLRVEGYAVTGVGSVAEAIGELERSAPAVVITDVNMPRSDGFELLRVLRQRFAEVVPIVITGYGTIESAVEAIKMGAYDYLTKPIVDDEIRLVLERAVAQQALLAENRSLKRQLGERYSLDAIIGHDHKMLKLFDLVETVADTRTTVLLTGESGTGKTLVARTLHQRSARRDKPFVEVSCGAVPETLLESELFGHVKGAFTGATAEKIGKVKAADGGTLFLDEINSASASFQAKLLRVLQERQFEPVGSNKTETVDVRFILACNVDLRREAQAGRFRPDLYYRIAVVTLQLPSLAERLGDIPRLAERFLAKYRAELGKDVAGIAPEALQALQRYHWPGNVRELENAIERAAVLCKGRTILVDDLPGAVLEPAPAARPGAAAGEWGWSGESLDASLAGPEKAILLAALQAHQWNRQSTAKALDINRTTLYKKMKRYGLEDAAR
ncbi:MAG: sigma-54 dependent transcriptional regulator [Phycisphaerae bacterium]